MFGDPFSNSMNWPTESLGNLFSVFSRGKQPSYLERSGVRVINQACIYWDKMNWSGVKYHDSDSGKKTLVINDGYVLINSTGTGTLGRSIVFEAPDSDYTYIADSHVTVLGSSARINPYFFHRFFRLDDTQKKIYAECVNGSTNQIELSKEKLSQIQLIVPPLELQSQFASFVRQSDKSKFAVQLCSNLNLSGRK